MPKYYFDGDGQVRLRGPPTPGHLEEMRRKPTTANLKERRSQNEAHQKHLDETYAVTFTNDVRAMTLTGHLFIQTSSRKSDKEGWVEMYSILDPFTKILSMHPAKNATRCYRAISLEGGRVIYGGEVPRTLRSERGGKQKIVKMHCMEITTYAVHTRRHAKHYLATPHKELCMEWIRDLAKVVHLGVDEKKKTAQMLKREEVTAC